MAAVAEHEREMISQRTEAALGAAKRAGKVLGKRTNPREASALGVEVRAAKALQSASNVLPIIRQIEADGITTLRGIAGARMLAASGRPEANSGILSRSDLLCCD